MPGVTITTSVRTGPSSATVRDSSQAFFVGLAQRGPSDAAVLVGSLLEFEETFGIYQSYAYLHPTVQAFFEEGGTQCYVARVVGPAATTASLDLDDSSAAAAITLTAYGPGDWAHNIDAEVIASGSNRNIRLYYNDELVYSTGLKSTNAALVNAINNSAVASKYVSASLEGETIVAAVAATPLAGGDDDRDDNTVDTTFTAFSDALELFLDSYGVGAVSCPETDEINTALIAHANAYNRMAILHSNSDDTVAEILTAASDLSGEDGAEHGALYYPWVYVPTEVSGVTRLIPPDGYVAGKRALAHNSTGPHQPAAGLLSASRFVSGVAADLNRTDGDSLDEGNVNAIRVIANSVRVYGARSLSTDTENFRFTTAQDVINSIVYEANSSMEDLVFSVVDARGGLFASIEGRLKGICDRMRNLGALYEGFDASGRQVDPGYTVKCDESLNTKAQLAEGTVKAQMGVRVSSIGDKIEVTIVKSNLTSTVTV